LTPDDHSVAVAALEEVVSRLEAYLADNSQELHQCREDLQTERAEREDFSRRWEEERRQLQQQIEHLKQQVVQKQEQAAAAIAQVTEAERLKNELEAARERERQLLALNHDLRNDQTVLTSTVNQLMSQLEEVLMEREKEGEQKRAIEHKVIAAEQTLKKQAALVTAMKGAKAGSPKPKSEKHMMLNVASRYY